MFLSYGNYGSTVWDPQNRDLWLEILICDACLIEHQNNVLEVHRKAPIGSSYKFYRWTHQMGDEGRVNGRPAVDGLNKSGEGGNQATLVRKPPLIGRNNADALANSP